MKETGFKVGWTTGDDLAALSESIGSLGVSMAEAHRAMQTMAAAMDEEIWRRLMTGQPAAAAPRPVRRAMRFEDRP